MPPQRRATSPLTAADCTSAADGFEVAQRTNAPLPSYLPVTKGLMASKPR